MTSGVTGSKVAFDLNDPRHVDLANAFINAEPGSTKAETIAQSGVSRSSFYEWMRSEAFRKDFWKHVNEAKDDLWRQRRPAILEAMWKEAEGGSLGHAKLAFQLQGELVERKEVQQSSVEVVEMHPDLLAGALDEADEGGDAVPTVN